MFLCDSNQEATAAICTQKIVVTDATATFGAKVVLLTVTLSVVRQSFLVAIRVSRVEIQILRQPCK